MPVRSILKHQKMKMKGINMSCTSQTSTAIIPPSMELLSSSPSSSNIGGRAIDRYNPIITDERRGGSFSRSAPTTPYCGAPISPKPHYPTSSPVILMASRKKKKNKFSGKSDMNININHAKPTNSSNHPSSHGDYDVDNSLIMKASCSTAAKNSTSTVDYISPPESSRYLLDDTSFLDVLSDFDQVSKNMVPCDSKKSEVVVESDHVSKANSKPSSSLSSSGSSNQVVVLRVSLHCRGCERKMKKHLSRMAGVTSFNIDFRAKKVTVVGDVTPLEVLASISKVKNAQLWTPTITSPFEINPRDLEVM